MSDLASTVPQADPNLLTSQQPDSDGDKPKMVGNFEIRELKQLGAQLPIGFLSADGKSRVRLFRMRPFRLKEEKAIGEIRERAKAMTYGTFVSKVLALMVQTLGPHNLDTMQEHQKVALIASLPVGDVLYMYLFLRYHALGSDAPVDMTLHCDACSQVFHFLADLNTLEVRVVPDEMSDLRWSTELRDPISVYGQQTDRLHMDLLKWGALERREYTQANIAEREALAMASSIVGAAGVKISPFFMQQSDLDELTRHDFAKVGRDIENNTPGPQMIVEGECTHCKSPKRTMLEWQNYDGFFSLGSQPSHGKR